MIGVQAASDWQAVGRSVTDEPLILRRKMTDPEIDSFILVEDGSLPRSEWTHTRHLVMALWYLRRHGQDEATRRIREGIQRYNLKQGGNPAAYHETITRAWIAVIVGFLSLRDRIVPDSVLADELLQECGDKDYLMRYYTRERLLSDECERAGSIPTSGRCPARVRPCRDAVD